MQQPNSYLSQFMETVRFEVELPNGKLEAVRTETQGLHIELGNSESEKIFLGKKCSNGDRKLRLSAFHGRGLGRNSRPLQKNFAYATTLSEKLASDATTIFN